MHVTQAVQNLGEIKESVANNNELAENCRHLLNTFRPFIVVQHPLRSGEANVQIGSMGGLTMTPTITRSLTMAVDLSKHHPLWKSIDNGDILGVYQLLESGSVRLDDRYGSSGVTPLHYICYFGFPRTNPRGRLSQQIEILKMLITKGADCDSLDYYGR
jgi:ankyrin repeat protein